MSLQKKKNDLQLQQTAAITPTHTARLKKREKLIKVKGKSPKGTLMVQKSSLSNLKKPPDPFHQDTSLGNFIDHAGRPKDPRLEKSKLHTRLQSSSALSGFPSPQIFPSATSSLSSGKKSATTSSVLSYQIKPIPSPKFVSSIFQYTIIDEEDEFEKAAIKCHEEIKKILENKTPSEIQQYLLDQSSSNFERHGEIQLFLLYELLLQRSENTPLIQNLMATSRDGFSYILSQLKYLTSFKFSKLQWPVVDTLLWIVDQLISQGIVGVDALLTNLSRHLKAADYSLSYMKFIESFLNLLWKHRDWIRQHPNEFSIQVIYYNVICLVHDHDRLTILKKLETDIVLYLLQYKFWECAAIGRDFIRTLQEVSKLAEFQPFWQKLYHNPDTLPPIPGFLSSKIESSSIPGHMVYQILSIPSNRKILAYRLSPLMESNLVFMMEHVTVGNHKRYQQWFLQNHLQIKNSSAAESVGGKINDELLRSFIPDLIRYICVVFHPPNSILQSNVLQRWMMTGWLVQLSGSDRTNFASCQLALYIDWLFYSTERDSIMNIEPGILIIYHSLIKYKTLTSNLLEFIFKIVRDSPWKNKLRVNVRQAMNTLLDKNVIPSLEPLLKSKELSDKVKGYVSDLFVAPSSSTVELEQTEKSESAVDKNYKESFLGSPFLDEPKGFISKQVDNIESTELIKQLKKNVIESITQKEDLVQRSRVSRAMTSSSRKSLGPSALLMALESLFINIFSEVESEDHKMAIIENICSTIKESSTYEDSSTLGMYFTLLVPIFDLLLTYFLKISAMGSEHSGNYLRETFNLLVSSLRHKLYYFGPYLLLYTLRDQNASLNAMYRQTVDIHFLDDCQKLHDIDIDQYLVIFPKVCERFSSWIKDNVDFIRILVSSLDPAQSFYIHCYLVNFSSETCSFLTRAGLVNVLKASLGWESYEQIFLWDIITTIVTCNKWKMDTWIFEFMTFLCQFSDFAEAWNGLNKILKCVAPSESLIEKLILFDYADPIPGLDPHPPFSPSNDLFSQDTSYLLNNSLFENIDIHLPSNVFIDRQLELGCLISSLRHYALYHPKKFGGGFGNALRWLSALISSFETDQNLPDRITRYLFRIYQLFILYGRVSYKSRSDFSVPQANNCFSDPLIIKTLREVFAKCSKQLKTVWPLIYSYLFIESIAEPIDSLVKTPIVSTPTDERTAETKNYEPSLDNHPVEEFFKSSRKLTGIYPTLDSVKNAYPEDIFDWDEELT